MKFQMFSVALLIVLASSALSQSVVPKDAAVTPVRGESWLSHLHRPFNDSSMGRTSTLGPPPAVPGSESPSGQPRLSPGVPKAIVTLYGSDLFRLNCQGCHHESGRGVPPEINSVIDPVRATSVEVIADRMKQSGGEMTRAVVADLAKQSKVLVLQRLHKGGQEMPPPTLDEAEIESVFAYLQELSGVPGADKKQIGIKESSYRVGEKIIKSTCHTCHGATGPNPTPQQILDGAIPPLSTLTTRVSVAEFVRKVHSGAPIVMGTPAMAYRGKMPVFVYLTEGEVADAYQYLTVYPPRR